jgi:hypothetical protein
MLLMLNSPYAPIQTHVLKIQIAQQAANQNIFRYNVSFKIHLTLDIQDIFNKFNSSVKV